MNARSHCAVDPLVRRPLLPNTGLLIRAFGGHRCLINCFLSITTIRYCFAYGFYNIAGLKGQIGILVSFIMPLLIILRASPLCRIARHVRHVRRTPPISRAAFLRRLNWPCYASSKAHSSANDFINASSLRYIVYLLIFISFLLH